MNNSTRQEQIETYLQARLSPEEQAAFEQEMQQDADLAAAVRLQQMIQDEFSDLPKQTFIRQLDELGTKHFEAPSSGTSIPWKYILLAGLLVIVVVWMIFRIIGSTENQPDPIPENTQLPVAPTTESPAVTPDQSEDLVPEPIPDRSPTETVTGDLQEPIAQIDPALFNPNPYLEVYLNSNTRGEEFQIKDIRVRLSKEAFILGGEFQITEEEPDTLLLFIYSNQEKDYLDGNYLYRLPLPLERLETDQPDRSPTGKIVATYKFDIKQNGDWKPGLYYYFLAWEQEEEPLFTNKIQLAAD